ncbi:MAG: hypothetical protein LBL46_00455 [Rickettsiales bacterium]|jgi:hypothetical protein|nr:hypothetical protein [Rickettsiales bacterium]
MANKEIFREYFKTTAAYKLIMHPRFVQFRENFANHPAKKTLPQAGASVVGGMAMGAAWSVGYMLLNILFIGYGDPMHPDAAPSMTAADMMDNAKSLFWTLTGISAPTIFYILKSGLARKWMNEK